MPRGWVPMRWMLVFKRRSDGLMVGFRISVVPVKLTGFVVPVAMIGVWLVNVRVVFVPAVPTIPLVPLVAGVPVEPVAPEVPTEEIRTVLLNTIGVVAGGVAVPTVPVEEVWDGLANNNTVTGPCAAVEAGIAEDAVTPVGSWVIAGGITEIGRIVGSTGMIVIGSITTG